ncbi:MAG TPA: Rieske (2Fe-2S) protein [Vicinamibacterales bacterium]|nr:Rieske (2Fe-2S) protein [Vicinamibacterales bacterium]
MRDRSEKLELGSEKHERRVLLKGAAGLAVAWMTPVRTDAQEAKAARPAAGDLLVKVGDEGAAALTPTDITGPPMLAWPMLADGRVVRSGSRLNRIVLVRVDPTGLSERTRAAAADGVVAYSAVCTHTGCEVAAFLTDEHALFCDCHQSKFNALDRGQVLDGPAPRPLPALPLRVVEGRLEVARPFSARPGAEQE